MLFLKWLQVWKTMVWIEYQTKYYDIRFFKLASILENIHILEQYFDDIPRSGFPNVSGIWVSSIQISTVNLNEDKGLRKKYYCRCGVAMTGMVVLASNMARASAILPCCTALIRLAKTWSGSWLTGFGVGTTWNKSKT